MLMQLVVDLLHHSCTLSLSGTSGFPLWRALMLVAINMVLSMLESVGLSGEARKTCLKNLFSTLTTLELINPLSLSISPKVTIPIQFPWCSNFPHFFFLFHFSHLQYTAKQALNLCICYLQVLAKSLLSITNWSVWVMRWEPRLLCTKFIRFSSITFAFNIPTNLIQWCFNF